jgi:hypothetical protein
MANTAIKILIIFIITTFSFKTVAQGNPKYEFLFNGCGQGEFYEYFSHNLKVWGNKPTFNLFIFKLSGYGKITEMRHLGGMQKTDAEHVMKFINQSENCWNLPADPKLFKWIILPFISSISSNSGIAVISFDLPSTFRCPSTSWLPLDHALTMCMGDFLWKLSFEPQTVFPSIKRNFQMLMV